jgi:hypothetical protein
MSTMQNVKLLAPAPNWGVERQPRRLDHPIRFVASVLICLGMIVAAINFYMTTPNTSPAGEGDSRAGMVVLALFVIVVAGVFVAPTSFSDPYYEYEEALKDAWAEYGRTHFRTWLRSAYGLKVSEKDASILFRGYDVWLSHENSEGRVEQVRTYVDNVRWLHRDTENFERANREHDLPRLMYVEAPAQPRTYQW